MCSVFFDVTTTGHGLKTWVWGALRYFQHKLFHCTAHLMDEGRYRPPYFTRFHSHSACLPACLPTSHLSPLAQHSHCVENLLRHQRYNLMKTVLCADESVRSQGSKQNLFRRTNCVAYLIVSEQVLRMLFTLRLSSRFRHEVDEHLHSSGLLCCV